MPANSADVVVVAGGVESDVCRTGCDDASNWIRIIARIKRFF